MMSMGPLGPPLGLAADVMGHGWLGLELGFGLLTYYLKNGPDPRSSTRTGGYCTILIRFYSGLFGEGGSVRNKSRIENSVIFIDNWR